MRHPMLLVTTLYVIVLMSDVLVVMSANNALRIATGQKLRQDPAGQEIRSELAQSTATYASDLDAVGQRAQPPGGFPRAVQVDFNMRLTARMGLSGWRQTEEPAPLSLFPATPAGKSAEGAGNLLPVQDEAALSDDGDDAPRASVRDWGGLGRDTAFFLGYEGMVAGILYLLPESVTKWKAEQRKTSMGRWWENVQHPVWDKDSWYLNYLGHPYFGAIGYIRARERGFGAFGGFWYAALLSSLYEFGIEALFERPSYQDLIVTPVGGLLLGALLFEPIRERIHGKPELQWYDHVTLAVTDPLGTANSILERSLGLEADIRVQFHLPALAPHTDLYGPTGRSLNRPQEHHRSPGVGIEFVFKGKKRSARHIQ